MLKWIIMLKKNRHKGKTPSFGNANAPLFINNIKVDVSEVNFDNHTPKKIEGSKKAENRKAISK